ncbi:hypothetical protein AB0K74_35980 [Streptomyces sp. NPDC056159]|uniref:hypothetical protein n=1 Tax=Streptomyces sp. NPDC056159 TaxID=3155537 RepID=UPI00341FCA88
MTSSLIKDEDTARLSPLKHRNLNVLGRYLFDIKASSPARVCGPSGTRTPSRTTRTKPENLMWMPCA